MRLSKSLRGTAARLFAVLAVGGLAACSPYAFSDSASVLSAKMTAIDTATKDTTQKIAAEKRQIVLLGWLRDRPDLARGPGCEAGTPVSEPCDLIVVGKPPPPAEPGASKAEAAKPPATKPDVCEAVPVDSASGAPESTKPPAAPTRESLPKLLDAYYAALVAITNAKDRTDFNTASAQISTAVSGLAQSAGTPGAGTLAKAATNAVFWVVGEGFDYQRLEELRRATRAACEPIHVLTDALATWLEEQQNLRLSGLTKLLIEQVQTANRLATTPGVTDAIYAAAIENAQTTADAYQAVKAASPKATMQALSDAHDAFVVAVRNNDGEFKTVVASLTALGQQADAVEAGAKADAAKAIPAKGTTSKATTAKAKK
jgi:hypothetical protein